MQSHHYCRWQLQLTAGGRINCHTHYIHLQTDHLPARNYYQLPSYTGLKLDEKNVVDVLHEAKFADGDWENLGQQLMIAHHALRTIRIDHPGQSSLCMSDTISRWLNNDLEASWEKLVEAVIKVEGYGEATAHIVQQKAAICTFQV